jgi:tetratricopeptide (TPR) repeat protein
VFRRFSIIILVSLLATAIRSQDLKQTLALGDQMFAFGQYDAALKLYNRAAFFGNDSIRTELFPLIAHSYFQTADYRNSLFYYELAANNARNDSLVNEYFFAKVLCYYVLEEYDYAVQQLLAFEQADDVYFMNRYYFYNALIYLKRDQPEESLEYFLKMLDSDEVRAQLTREFAKARLHLPNPNTAKILSIILPGMGQLYSGDYKNAVNSLMLTGALAGLTVLIAVNYSFLDAALSTVSWLQRYYMGGFTRAGVIARERQIEKRELLLSRSLELLESAKQSE